MKYSLAILLLASMLIVTSCQQEPSFTDLQGHTIHLSDYKNKWLFINYWAHWCKPCYQEVPELNAFSHKKNVAILGVSFDAGSPEQLKAWVEKLKIQFPVLTQDPATALGIDSIPGLPTTIVIDPQGHIKTTLYGPQTQESLSKVLS